MNEEVIFHEALARGDPQERAAYLDQACVGNPALRASVEALLRANVGATGFLDQPPQANAANEQAMAEGPGTLIGPYKLLEQIGEGGFGVVFLAEQTEPVRRKVALKVLKPGMDTRQVVARFEAERQALAIMDHPNIAKVFDGGATSSGRPYFVMELVKGVPITEFCDQNCLTLRQRLEMFIPVCQAVQHAHQKGIIHRDLKPSNILVSRHDTTPVVKVIDFGVAKAIGQELTDKTLFTGVAQLIGTPLYMSPEQAGMSDLDVDTRSDIYSLGVLLYELLTGTTPFDKERLRTAAYDEIRRIIREQEPSTPSTKLSTAEGLPALAANRGTEPAKLTKLVRGELDWIVMMALEKDRNRRYETANELAMDVQRYLADEPVRACPPSAWYRFGKFARRNKRMIAAATVTAGALLTAMVIMAVSAWMISQQQKENKAALAQAQQQRKRAEANFDDSLNAMTDLLSLLDRKDLADVPRISEVRRALAQQIEQYYKRFLKEESTDPAVRFETARAYISLGSLHETQGNLEEAELARKKAITLFETLAADYREDPAYWKQLGHSHHNLAGQMERRGLIEQATEEYRKALHAFEEVMRLAPDDHRSPNNLACQLLIPNTDFRNPLKAVELAEKATRLAPRDEGCWNTLGKAHYYAGNWHAAIAALEKSLEYNPIGGRLPVAYTWFYLAMSHGRLGQNEEARRWHGKATEWIDRGRFTNHGELRQLRNEAEAVLEINHAPQVNPEQLNNKNAAGEVKPPSKSLTDPAPPRR